MSTYNDIGMPLPMAVVYMLNFIGNYTIINAVTAAWISTANIWMFGGLLVMMKKVRN